MKSQNLNDTFSVVEMLSKYSTYLGINLTLSLNYITHESVETFYGIRNFELIGSPSLIGIVFLLTLSSLKPFSNLLYCFDCFSHKVCLLNCRLSKFIPVALYRHSLCIVLCMGPYLRRFDSCCGIITLSIMASYMMIH